MDEGAKEPPKTYTMDDLIAHTKNNEIETLSTSGAKDWIENPTRFKLREAKYFLDKARKAYTTYVVATTDKNRDALLFSLDAFFSAARSITFYMQNQYAEKPNFWEWYCPKQISMKGDDELKFLNNLRVNFIHIGPPTITTVRADSYGMDCPLVYADDHPLKGTETPVMDMSPSKPLETGVKTLDVIFDADEYTVKEGLKEDIEVLPFCHRQLEKLEALVDECEKHFNRPPRDPCEKLAEDKKRVTS